MKAVRLKRQMNELEHGLLTTVFVLVLLLIVLFFSGALHTEPPSIMMPPPSPHHQSKILSLSPFDSFPFFLPGTLSLNRTESLHRCHLPSLRTLPHTQGCSLSTQYKIVFHLTPKSGSSTGRHVIKADFGGKDFEHGSQCVAPASDWLSIAVLRNPATRAFASYEEMFVRRLGAPNLIPSSCRDFMRPFEGWIYKNYSDLFDTKPGVALLNEAYETFMRDWDGTAFDMHLESQVAYNVRRYGEVVDARHLNWVFDTHAMEASFALVAKMVGLNKRPKVIKGRAYPRRLNVTDVSDEAFQAMCRRYRDDFCCLNYGLPPQCLKAREGKRVRCKWVDGEGKIEAVVV